MDPKIPISKEEPFFQVFLHIVVFPVYLHKFVSLESHLDLFKEFWLPFKLFLLILICFPFPVFPFIFLLLLQNQHLEIYNFLLFISEVLFCVLYQDFDHMLDAHQILFYLRIFLIQLLIIISPETHIFLLNLVFPV